ncbi:MAG: hypothetical protein K6V97_04130 [Actinomycetia bacterium]|nr:hypothetical protein [Actinomycetes bacterium]
MLLPPTREERQEREVLLGLRCGWADRRLGLPVWACGADDGIARTLAWWTGYWVAALAPEPRAVMARFGLVVQGDRVYERVLA